MAVRNRAKEKNILALYAIAEQGCINRLCNKQSNLNYLLLLIFKVIILEMPN